MPVTLIGDLSNENVQKIILVSAYSNIALKIANYNPEAPHNDHNKYILNCHCLNEIPVLKTSEGYLMETTAIIRYLSRTQKLLAAVKHDEGDRQQKQKGSKDRENNNFPADDYKIAFLLYGKTIKESAEVDEWIDFCETRLNRFLQINNNNKEKINEALKALNLRLERKKELILIEQELLMSDVSPRGHHFTPRNSIINGNNNNAGEGGNEREDIEYLIKLKEERRRLSTFYNVAGSVRNRHSVLLQGDAAADSSNKDNNNNKSETPRTTAHAGGGVSASSPRLTLNLNAINGAENPAGENKSPSLTPRPSLQAATSARKSKGGGSAVAAVKYVFMVGDSLTTADLVLAMTLHAVYKKNASDKRLKSEYGAAYAYYRSILSLPVATDICKALSITLQ